KTHELYGLGARRLLDDDFALSSVFSAHWLDLVAARLKNGVVGVPEVDTEQDMARYYRWSARRNDEPPDGEADHVGRIAHQPLEAADDPHCCQQRVLAPPSWSRAGVRVLAAD